jgi:pimeloyl-ACP methyl ester carboxylesterase
MPKSVFHFGESAHRLLGALQTPVRLQPRSAAILLCNPLGEEASRAHRLYRVLATQLERQGYSSLRFDYRGSGDSDGEEEGAGPEQWVEDIEAAAAELGRRTAIPRVVLVGVRLGATLAAMACTAGRLRVRQLVLWDPVVDGEAHLAELATVHADYFRGEFPTRDPHAFFEAGKHEYLGLQLTELLTAQLRAIDLAALDPPADRITVIRARTGQDSERLQAAWAGRSATRFVDAPGGQNWNSDAALNAATVPAEIVRAIVANIEEHCP